MPLDKFLQWHFLQGEASYYLYKGRQEGHIDRATRVFASSMKGFSDKMERLAANAVRERPTSDPHVLARWEDDVRKIGDMALDAATRLGIKHTYTAIRQWKPEPTAYIYVENY